MWRARIWGRRPRAARPRGGIVASGEGDAEIFRLDLASHELRRLTYSRGDDASPRYAPDGASIAYVSLRQGALRAFVMGADGAHPHALIAAADAEPPPDSGSPAPQLLAHEDLVFSPDGARIALVERRTGRANLRIVRVSDGRVLAQSSGPFHDQTPCFSPDGAWIAFSSDRSGDVEIYRMRSDGSDLAAVTQSPGADWLPRWLAD